MATVLFYSTFKLNKVRVAPSSAPTITLYRIERATGTESLVASAQATTASSLTGRYFYRLTGADPVIYEYHGSMDTTDTAGVDDSQIEVGSLLLTANVVAVDEAAADIDTDVAAIKAKTDLLPAVAAGAAGGLLIAGSNAATTFAAFTCTGNFAIADGLTITCTTANRSAISATGNGSGGGR